MAADDMEVIRSALSTAFAMTRVEEDLRLEGLAALAGTMFKEGLGCGGDGGFVGDAETGELVEGGASRIRRACGRVLDLGRASV